MCFCAVAQAWNETRARFKVFASMPDAETGKKVAEAVETAKVTLLEFRLLEGVLASVVKDGLKGAVKAVTDAIKSMTNVKPPVSAESVHPTLWKVCHNVLEGTKVD